MEIKDSIDAPSFQSSKQENKNLKKEWEKQFWDDQHIEAVKSDDAAGKLPKSQKIGDAIFDKSPNLEASVPTLPISNSNNIKPTAEGLKLAEPVSGQMPVKPALKTVTPVLTDTNLSLPQVNNKKLKSEAGFNHYNMISAKQEEHRSGLIQKKDREVKLWTSHESEDKNWKHTLKEGFAFFGLTLARLVVRGKDQ